MRISDWSSDVCSSDLALIAGAFVLVAALVDALRDVRRLRVEVVLELGGLPVEAGLLVTDPLDGFARGLLDAIAAFLRQHAVLIDQRAIRRADFARQDDLLRRHHRLARRSEEHTSELQSLMRTSYAVFCLK